MKSPSSSLFHALFVFLLVFLHPLASNAATFTVSSTADAGANTLRQAILDANASGGHDTIDFNLPNPSTITLSAALLNFDLVTISGPGSDELTIEKSTASDDRIIDSSGVSLTVSGCTLRDGDVSAVDGGAIRFIGGANGTDTLFLTDVVFINNRALATTTSGGRGGAVYVSAGNLSVNDCRFQQNLATNSGGAICIRPNTIDDTPIYTIDDSTFNTNIAGSRGGAIDFEEGIDVVKIVGEQLLVTSCAFVDNSVSGGGFVGAQGGGALRAEVRAFFVTTHLQMKLTTCQFTNNDVNGTGGVGGGVSLRGGDASNNGTDDLVKAVLDRCTFTANDAKGDGGALHIFGTTAGGANDKSAADLSNCTIDGNSAGEAVGLSGTFAGGVSARVADLKFDGCTVTGNTGLGKTGAGTGVVGGIDIVGAIELTSTVIADNTGAHDAGSNADELRSDVGGTSNGDNFIRGGVDSFVGFAPAGTDVTTDTDPLLGGLTGSAVLVGATGDTEAISVRVPAVGSPLIGAGATTLTFDQIGTDRLVNAPPEIGAVEVLSGGQGGGALIITEIMYDPLIEEADAAGAGHVWSMTGNPAWEWVEIYNPGVVPVDLSGYVIDNGDSNAFSVHNIDTGSVPPGEAVVIYNGAAISAVNFRDAWGQGVPLVKANEWGKLSSTGGKVALWDSFLSYNGDHVSHTNAVDSVDYGSFGLSVSGQTIHLSDLMMPASWTVSVIDLGIPQTTPLNDTYQSTQGGGNSGTCVGSPYEGSPAKDFGDLPDQSISSSSDYPTLAIHDGARHIITPSELRLGDEVDSEDDGAPSAAAVGDDTTDAADEDGVILPPMPLTNGETVAFQFVVTNLTGKLAHLVALFDWNADGDLGDVGERFEFEIPDGLDGEVIELDVAVPGNARTRTDLGARFRLSTLESLGATGLAPDGEVEDYLVQTQGIDWGDLPDLGPGTGPGDYETLSNSGGPNHVLDPLLRFSCDGLTPDPQDAEPDGQPNSLADGDDLAGVGDEYCQSADFDGSGIYYDDPVFDPVAGTGSLALRVLRTVFNETGNPATIYGFFDFNGDGDFDDAGETQTELVPPGTHQPLLQFDIPQNYVAYGDNQWYLRLRISTDPSLGPNGPAPDGMVEDIFVAFNVEIHPMFLDHGDHLEFATFEFENPDPFAPTFPAPTGDSTIRTLQEGGPVHIQTSALTLGPYLADGEMDGQPSANADGDDQNGADDENGITVPTSLVLGTTAAFPATVTNNSGVPAFLLGWVDWNGDGLFQATEAAPPVPVPDGSTALAVNVEPLVPIETTATGRELAARFRLTLDPDLGPNGASGIGEVEDYLVGVLTDSDLDGQSDRYELLNFGDLTTSDGSTDTDSDGSTDEEEEENGTDPNDPSTGIGTFALTGDLVVGDEGSNTILRIRNGSGAVVPLFDPDDPEIGIPGFDPDLAGSNMIVAPAMLTGITAPPMITGITAPPMLNEINTGLGEIYFLADSTGGRLLAHLAPGGSIDVLATFAEIESDTGLPPIDLGAMAFGSNGKIHAIDRNGGGVIRINAMSGAAEVFTTQAAIDGVAGINGVLIGLTPLPAGEFAFIDANSDSLLKLAFDGAPTLLAGSGSFDDLTPDSSMTVLPGGDLLVVDSAPDEVLRVTPTGAVSVHLSHSVLRAATRTGDVSVRGIAGNSDGEVMVVNRDSSAGDSLIRFASPGREVLGQVHMDSVLNTTTVLSDPIFGPRNTACDFTAATVTLASTGDALPGGGTLGGFYEYDMNNGGSLVFSASQEGVPGSGQGVFFLDEFGALEKVMVQGDVVPAGTFGSLTTRVNRTVRFMDRFGRTRSHLISETVPGDVKINDRGDVGVWSKFRADGEILYRDAIFHWSPLGLNEVVRTGTEYIRIADFREEVFSVKHQFDLNEQGIFAFIGRSSFFSISTSVVMTGQPFSLPEPVDLYQTAGLESVDISDLGQLSYLRSGFTTADQALMLADQTGLRSPVQTMPSSSEQLLGAPAINNHGQIAFTGPDDGGRLEPSEALYFFANGVTTVVHSEGDPTPDGFHFFKEFSKPQINDRSEVAIKAEVFNNPFFVGPAATGIYIHDAAGQLTEVVQTGRPAPNGGVFSAIHEWVQSESVVAFTASVDEGLPAHKNGLYIYGAGSLLEIVRPDKASTTLRLVDANDANQVAYIVTGGDGSESLRRTHFARALHYESTRDSSWDLPGNWTLGIAPGEDSIVCIDPPVGLDVNGPAGEVTVRRLRIDASGSNPAGLRLRSSGVLRAAGGTNLGDKGRITGEGTLSGVVHAEEGSVIDPAGDMALGDRHLADAFDSGGTIFVRGGRELSLDSATPVQLLGLTEMLGGQLTAWSDIANSGTLRGDGVVDGVISNDGQIRTSTGERLMLWGLSNSRQVDVLGGEFEVILPVVNHAQGGEIFCRDALLRFNSGLQNEGELYFSFGTSDVFGTIDNAASGRVIVSGQSEATFWDDVHMGQDDLSGGVFAVDIGSTVVFFGHVSGPGPVIEDGLVRFHGGYSPGSSPASVSFGGDVTFGATSTVVMELGGTAQGTGYDHLDIHGTLELRSGVMRVELIDGFEPSLRDRFDLFDWGTLDGEFRTVVLPALASGQYWHTAQLYTTGEISVGCVPESFELWQEENFTAPELADAGLSGFDADFDADGLKNGIEYILGSDPRSDSSHRIPMLMADALDPRLDYVFEMPEQLGVDITMQVQASGSLTAGSWTTIATKTGSTAWAGAATVTVDPLAGGKVRVSVEDTEDISAHTRRFLRLVGTYTP